MGFSSFCFSFLSYKLISLIRGQISESTSLLDFIAEINRTLIVSVFKVFGILPVYVPFLGS